MERRNWAECGTTWALDAELELSHGTSRSAFARKSSEQRMRQQHGDFDTKKMVKTSRVAEGAAPERFAGARGCGTPQG